MRHKEYNDYFRGIAANHNLIVDDPSATDGSRTFARIIVSESLFPRDYTEEVFNSMRNKFPATRHIMLLENYTSDHADNRTGSPQKGYDGAFYIIAKDGQTEQNHEAQETIIDACEETAEDIMAYMYETFANECGCKLLDFHMHKVGPLGDGPFFGVKVYFQFLKNGAAFGFYNASKWIIPLP